MAFHSAHTCVMRMRVKTFVRQSHEIGCNVRETVYLVHTMQTYPPLHISFIVLIQNPFVGRLLCGVNASNSSSTPVSAVIATSAVVVAAATAGYPTLQAIDQPLQCVCVVSARNTPGLVQRDYLLKSTQAVHSSALLLNENRMV